MTCSVVAIVTDQIVDGKPVVGYGFNSNGRYNASGILKDRMIPRLLEADPSHLVGDDGYLDPHNAWAVMMTNEKPGVTVNGQWLWVSLIWLFGMRVR